MGDYKCRVRRPQQKEAQQRRDDSYGPSRDNSKNSSETPLHARARNGANADPLGLTAVLRPCTACNIVAQRSEQYSQASPPDSHGAQRVASVLTETRDVPKASLSSGAELTPNASSQRRRLSTRNCRRCVRKAAQTQTRLWTPRCVVNRGRGNAPRPGRQASLVKGVGLASQLPLVCPQSASHKAVWQDRARL